MRLGREVAAIAYPFGWPGTYSQATKTSAQNAGYRLAFTSRTGVNYRRHSWILLKSTGSVSDQVIRPLCCGRALPFSPHSAGRSCKRFFALLYQSDHDNLGPAKKSNRWRDGTHATGNEHLTRWRLSEPVKVFLTITRWDDRCSQTGDYDLPTMGMAAQDKADSAIANYLGEVGVMRKQDDGVLLGSIAECGAKILAVSPEIANPTDTQPGAAAIKPYASVIQVRQSRISQGCR